LPGKVNILAPAVAKVVVVPDAVLRADEPPILVASTWNVYDVNVDSPYMVTCGLQALAVVAEIFPGVLTAV